MRVACVAGGKAQRIPKALVPLWKVIGHSKSGRPNEICAGIVGFASRLLTHGNTTYDKR